MAHTCNPSMKRLRQGDHKFKDSLGYVASSSPVWTTQGHLSSKNKQTSRKQTKQNLKIYKSKPQKDQAICE